MANLDYFVSTKFRFCIQLMFRSCGVFHSSDALGKLYHCKITNYKELTFSEC